MIYQKKWIQQYLEALEKEIETIYQKEPLETIYIGGGTPSCLDIHELEKLFSIIKKLNKIDEVEFTIEGNFESTTKEKLELYKKNGVNRLSFGLESTNPEQLSFLNRQVNKNHIEEMIQEARNLGFSNINVDLIYALPKENKEILAKDLNYIFQLGVEHISTYSLIIEKNTILDIHKEKNIEEDLDYEMYQEICQQMRKNHYKHYEISNFCKEDYESKHNTTYWNNEEYYGFGLGASSYRKNKRIENTRSLTAYCNGNYQKAVEIVSNKDKMEYQILLNLRKKEGISLSQFQEIFHKKLGDCYDYRELEKQGFLKTSEDHLFIPEEKWYISNEIIVELLERETV